MNNISHTMIYAGKMTQVCDHYCKKTPHNTRWYKWYSYLDHEFIKLMCEKCALREAWGYNYKQKKKYKRWKESCSIQGL